MDKKSIVNTLKEVALLLELRGENSFKIRAYRHAARRVDLLTEEELRRLVQEDRLQEMEGVGPALEQKLRELVLTGRMDYHEEVRGSLPPGLMEVLRVPGLGPRKVKVLHDALGIASLGELEHACRENRLVNLPGFGTRTQEKILQGIERLRRYQGHHFLHEARHMAAELVQDVRGFSGLGEVSLAGSIRRCQEIVRDIDLVASADRPAELTRFFAALPRVDSVTARGDTRATVQLSGGISADLRAVRSEEFPYALHHFTGSQEHNTALRHRARGMGLKMNEYGLFRGEKPVPCRDEGDIFKALGLDYIPPELRENTGEIEAAEEDRLPRLVEEADVKGVFHVHTQYSDGSHSLEEMVNRCRELDLEYIGFADHSQSAFYAGGLTEEELARQQEEIWALRQEYPDIGIFSGIEADILSDGSLDYPDQVLERLDFVIASVHTGLNMAAEKMTPRLLRALSHPRVTMLGHPTGRLLLGREAGAVDLEQVFQAARDHGVILELNASPSRLDLDWRYLPRIRDLGLQVSINPDAHRMEELSYLGLGVCIARKGWLEKKDVFNTRSRREVESFLELS